MNDQDQIEIKGYFYGMAKEGRVMKNELLAIAEAAERLEPVGFTSATVVFRKGDTNDLVKAVKRWQKVRDK